MSEKDLPSTSSSRCSAVLSYSHAGWCRLREVCSALKEMREKVAKQKDEIDAILRSEESYREEAALIQSETIELRSIRERIERAKYRLMTLQLKLIHVYGDMESRDKETNERRDEVLKMDLSFQQRLARIALFRDKISVAASRLTLRRRKMLKELILVYNIDLEGLPISRTFPTTCACISAATIAGLHLPDPRSLTGHSEVEVATAAGFQASRSSIVNPISTEIFPLYSLTRNREKFEEALNHLNGNIEQLRSDCGLGTPNKHATLANLHSLLLHLTFEDAEPKFARPVRNVQSPASVLRTSISDSVMLDHVKKVSEDRKSSTASRVEIVKSSPRCSSADSRSSSLLFDSSAVAALSFTSRSTIGNSSKVPHSESINGELIFS